RINRFSASSFVLRAAGETSATAWIDRSSSRYRALIAADSRGTMFLDGWMLDKNVLFIASDFDFARLFESADACYDLLLGFFDRAHLHRTHKFHVFFEHVHGAFGHVPEDLFLDIRFHTLEGGREVLGVHFFEDR